MKLETRRLLLRPLRDDDAPALALGVNNLNVSRNLARVKFPYTLQDAEAYIASQRNFEPHSLVCGIAFRAAPDELIGVVSYEYGTNKNDAVFGYWLRECCWKMRIMSEAASALVHHAFTQGQVNTLLSDYHNDNPNSGRILQRLGFVETQHTMSFCLAENRNVPSTQLKLTAEAWAAQQKSRAA